MKKILVSLMPIPIAISPSNKYMAGSDGKIYSKHRAQCLGRNAQEWYPLSASLGGGRYLQVTLSHNGTHKIGRVHRLICIAFHGMPNPPSLQARHLDGNTLNCRPTNLAWGTSYDQWMDARRNGKSQEGERHWKSKFTNAERKHLRWAIQNQLCSPQFAAEMLGVFPSTIRKIVKSKVLE